ncbi:MAG: zinc ribbon domain-containing protein [Phycisphaerae bacterium]
MSILFRCPCGRSMVVESDKAGAVVMCPNCRRRLKVPSGKGRGVEIPAAPATAQRTSRRCPRCGKDVPVDSQMCPHCQTVLADDGTAKAPAQAAATATPVRTGTSRTRKRRGGMAIGQPAGGIVYGGARGGWYARLTPGGKAGVVIGILFFFGLVTVLVYLFATWHLSGQLHQARETCQRNLARGRALETEGKFQEAYDLYTVPKSMLNALKNSDAPSDAKLAAQLERRATALQYLVFKPKIRGSVYWKPDSQKEFDEAMAYLKQHYGEYRQLALRVAEAGLTAVKAGMEDLGRAAFQEKVAQTMEAYMEFIDQTTEQQRAQLTFQQLSRGLSELSDANEHYADAKKREMHLTNSEQYFLALKERVSKAGYPDAILNR